jgi:hypothetical protein
MYCKSLHHMAKQYNTIQHNPNNNNNNSCIGWNILYSWRTQHKRLYHIQKLQYLHCLTHTYTRMMMMMSHTHSFVHAPHSIIPSICRGENKQTNTQVEINQSIHHALLHSKKEENHTTKQTRRKKKRQMLYNNCYPKEHNIRANLSWTATERRNE